jgi:hypothetical protein
VRQPLDKRMNDETLTRLGLKNNDFDEVINSKDELIIAISVSGRLFRKVLRHLIIRDLRKYFGEVQLDDSDRIEPYFTIWDRKTSWKKFRDSMQFSVPKLRTTTVAKISMIGYLIFYGYMLWYLLSKYADIILHLSLSGIALDGLIFLGALIPTLGIFSLGQRRLPAKNIEELVDKIIQENLFDFLTSDKEKLRTVLDKELSGD